MRRCFKFDDGLVMEDELVLLQGGAQVALEGDALDLTGMELGAVDDVASLALALGTEEGDIRIGSSPPGPASASIITTPALALTVPVQLGGVGLLHRIHDAAGDHLEVAAIAHSRQQHGELVTAQAGYQVGGAQAALDAPGRAPQDLVADVVAHRVVDRLETVEVEEHERQLRAGLGVALQLPLEGSPVGEPGERVDTGHVRDLGVARGQLGPRPVEVEAHHHQRGGEDRRPGGDQGRRGRGAGQRVPRHDGDDAQGDGRQGREGQDHPQPQGCRAGLPGDGLDQCGGLGHGGEHMHYSRLPR